MSSIRNIFIGLVLSVFSASAIAEEEICAPFKDGVVDGSVISKMLAAANDGHLYRIEPSSSRIGFCIESPMGLIEGEFKEFTGGLTFLQENVSTDEHALVMVNTASLETDGSFIEGILKGKKFFDVENYPEILFVSTGFKWVSETEAVLLGDLTMRGVTKTVGFHVKLIKQPVDDEPGAVEQQHRIMVKAMTRILRSEFGLTALAPMVGDSVNLCMSVEAVKYSA